jgi:hypothetical protein
MPVVNPITLVDDGQVPSRTLKGEGRVSESVTVGEELEGVAYGLHWLQVTAHPVSESPLAILPEFLTPGEFLGGEGQGPAPGWVRQLNYDRCCVLVPGGYVMWSSSRSEQGVHVRLNGSEIDVLRVFHGNLDELLFDWVQGLRRRMRVNVSRADVFADFYGAGCPVEPLGRAVIDGEARSRALLNQHMSESEWGRAWSVYVGKRKSGKLMRVYDKGREVATRTGVFPGEWTRLEIEFHGDYASALFSDELAWVSLSRLLLNTAAHMVAFPVEWWRRAVVEGNERRLVSVRIEGERDGLLWLSRTCLPAVVRSAGRLDSFELLEPLVEALKRAAEGNRKARRLLSTGLLRAWLLRIANGEL